MNANMRNIATDLAAVPTSAALANEARIEMLTHQSDHVAARDALNDPTLFTVERSLSDADYFERVKKRSVSGTSADNGSGSYQMEWYGTTDREHLTYAELQIPDITIEQFGYYGNVTVLGPNGTRFKTSVSYLTGKAKSHLIHFRNATNRVRMDVNSSPRITASWTMDEGVLRSGSPAGVYTLAGNIALLTGFQLVASTDAGDAAVTQHNYEVAFRLRLVGLAGVNPDTAAELVNYIGNWKVMLHFGNSNFNPLPLGDGVLDMAMTNLVGMDNPTRIINSFLTGTLKQELLNASLIMNAFEDQVTPAVTEQQQGGHCLPQTAPEQSSNSIMSILGFAESAASAVATIAPFFL
jgi:hypothetical protein